MPDSTAIAILRLLTQKPPPRWKPNRRAKLTDEQATLLAVLSDEWLERGTPGGQLLAERLRHTLTDQRCAELGFETWLGICSLHRLVLFLMPEPVFDEIAAAGDEALAFRVVAWLKAERTKSALHEVVAKRAWRALAQVEREAAAPILSEPYSQRYQLPARLTVEFGVEEGGDLIGVRGLLDAQGFEVRVEAIVDGPLHELMGYHPPPSRYESWGEVEEEW